MHPIYPVLPELPEIMVIDNHEGFLPDNDNWHTDVTFSQTPPLAGILACKRVPAIGGDTLWSSASASYDALSEPLKRQLDGLTRRRTRWSNRFRRSAGRTIRKPRSATSAQSRSIRP